MYSTSIEIPEYWCQSEYSKNEIHTKPTGQIQFYQNETYSLWNLIMYFGFCFTFVFFFVVHNINIDIYLQYICIHEIVFC